MQLKRLEAYGFKSFADRIEIEFDRGVTAIVGPNGSGKSNIADAIRWVLGEQNVRNLRGTKAEDIIFTGSAARKPLGVAEVSLVFENQGDMAVDFKEVAVTRRLFRSGESEFYINRARCRLKDIYNLFADTGIGHDGMSMIGQNRVDDVLNSKPEDRRAFFEETAGITKYRNRKKETLRKLEETERALEMVQNGQRELESLLGPLEQQAERTRQFNEWNAAYQKVRLTSLHQRHASFAATLEENAGKQQEQKDQSHAFRAQVQTAEARVELLAKEAIDLEGLMQAKAEQNDGIRTELETVGSRMATLRERQEQRDALRERILRQREELSAGIASTQQDVSVLEAGEQKQKDDLAFVEELLAKEQAKARELEGQIRAQDGLCRSLDEALAKRRQELAGKQQELALAEHDIAAQASGREEREKAREAMRSELERMRREQDALCLEQQGLELQDKRLQDELQEKKQELAQRSREFSETRREERDRQQELSAAEQKIQFLQRMQQAYEGFGRAPKAVLRSTAPWRKGVCGAVAELLQVPKEYVTAVEVALGGNLQNIVTEDTDTAKAAISFLKRERLGRVTFLPLSTITVRDRKREDTAGMPGVLGYASELVGIDPKYRSVAEFLLSRTLVMDTLDHALAMAKRQGYRMRIVTLEGELLSPGGALSGGSRQQKEASFLNRSGEIESLQQGAKGARDRLAELEKLHGIQERALAALDDALEALEKRRQQDGVRLAELRVSLEHASETIRERERVWQEQERQFAEQQESFATLEKRRVLLAREKDASARAAEEAEREAQEAGELLDSYEQEAEDLSEHRQQREVKRAVLEQQIQQSRSQILLLAKDLAKRQEELARNHAEEEELEQSLRTSGTELAELEGRNGDLQGRYDAGLAEHKALHEQRMAKLTERADAEKAAKELGRQLHGLEGKLHELELEASRVQVSQQECEETMLQEFGLTPERAAQEALDVPPEEIGSRLSELSDRIKGLGQVNPNAPSEYEEMRTRYAFKEQQSQDILEAKENLLSILQEMDATMTKQFREAFAQIQVFFGEIFVRLFGGGKAELELLDESDVLNTGVEILVQLPQKKRQNLSALSGGERALTVIALLFAFLRYRPSPFSVLDEIDAPLDEANVVRFGSFLREFSERTQFIVVTHRKGTMESVDRMYGVTIEDAGVSRILSVKLDDIKASDE